MPRHLNITDPNYNFEFPTQVAFADPCDGIELGGIAYKHEVICGCCGTRYSTKTLLTPLGSYIKVLPWTDISNKILGENENENI